jgi:hypothetical protein
VSIACYIEYHSDGGKDGWLDEKFAGLVAKHGI